MRTQLAPPWILVLAILLMLGLHFFLPLAAIVPRPWRLLGVLPLALGIVFNIWADNIFKQVNTTVKPFEKSQSLVTTGPFRFSRHPMYVGMTAILVGLALCLGTITPMFVAPLFVGVMHIVFIPAEERMMEEQFTREYRAYRKRVRSWL
ncbi:MAG: isoprenylcysteine carboxylmethyltransferase family protein [Planctomycetes bacterium]|nr:isoprenylcysteine carboxylmethyltransferase family protein [Planctomycetota bacterium]